MTKTLHILALAAVVGILAGCNSGGSPVAAGDTTPVTVPMPKVTTVAEAGVPPEQEDAKMLNVAINDASRKVGPARSDPFALRSDEQQYEREQNTERVVSSIGGFAGAEFAPPKDQDDAPRVVEPQPYRRLAGVVVGDSVLALLDMGNGQTYLVRPGTMIPNSEWQVVSIDEEKAVLRRGGTALPHEITVRLELPPPGMGGGAGAGFNGGNGGPPPGGFGGPPPGGGFPGGGFPGGRGKGGGGLGN